MTHDELVEKVARAIVTEMGMDPDEIALPHSGTSNWQSFKWEAEAAIAAMREVLESDLTLKAAMDLEPIGCWCQGLQRDQFHNFCDYHQGFESGVDVIAKAAGMVAE